MSWAADSRVDILVNNVWGGYENMAENGVWTWNLPFWQQPLWRWDRMEKSGRTLVTAALALEYGFTDMDGRQPRPLSLVEA